MAIQTLLESNMAICGSTESTHSLASSLEVLKEVLQKRKKPIKRYALRGFYNKFWKCLTMNDGYLNYGASVLK
jgi:hypothetical protein